MQHSRKGSGTKEKGAPWLWEAHSTDQAMSLVSAVREHCRVLSGFPANDSSGKRSAQESSRESSQRDCIRSFEILMSLHSA